MPTYKVFIIRLLKLQFAKLSVKIGILSTIYQRVTRFAHLTISVGFSVWTRIPIWQPQIG